MPEPTDSPEPPSFGPPNVSPEPPLPAPTAADAVWPPRPTGVANYDTYMPHALRFAPIRTLSIILLVLFSFDLASEFLSLLRLAAEKNMILAFVSTGVNAITMITNFVSWILWFVWVYRIYSNLASFGVRGSTTPGWFVAYHLIPILQLYKPYVLLKEVWNGSRPDASGATVRELRRTAPLILGYWIVTLIYLVAVGLYVGNIVQIAATGTMPPSNDSTTTVVTITAAIYAVLTMAVIYKISARQEHTAKALNLI